MLVADDVKRRCVLQIQLIAGGPVRFYQLGELTVRIDYKWEVDLMRGGILFCKWAQRIFRDSSKSCLKTVSQIIPQDFGMGVKIAGENRGVIRPGMHGQREIVANDRDLVGAGRFFEQGRRSGAIGTLQVLENN